MISLPRIPLKFILVGSALIALPTATSFAFTDLARGSLTLDTSLTGTFDSYVFGSTHGNSDFYSTLRPDLAYARHAGLSSIDADLGVGFNRYDKNTQFNSEDLNANFRATLPVEEGSRISGSLTAGYNEGRVVDPLVVDLIETKTATVNFTGSYQLSYKMALSDTFSFTDVVRDKYSNQRMYDNTVSYSYSHFLEETSLSLSWDYMKTATSGDNIIGVGLDEHANSFNLGLNHPIVGDLIGSVSYGYRILDYDTRQSLNGTSKDEGSTFSVGLTGPLLPPSRFTKLQSSASISYQQANSPGIGDNGGKTIVGSVNLSWNARERTRLGVNASRSQQLSANDFTVIDNEVSAFVSEDVGYFTHLNGSVGYSWRKYQVLDRQDNTFSASLSSSYSITKYWSASLSYTYQNNQADGTLQTVNGPLGGSNGLFGVGNYHRHIVSFSFSYKF